MKGKKLSYKERMQKLHDCDVERRRVFKDLLNHIEAGYSLDCFSALSDDSIRMFLKDYPEEFVEQELIESMRKAKEGWEEIGRKQASGSCLGNSRSWQYNMINRYGWTDRVEQKTEHKGEVKVSIVNYASSKQSTT